MLCLPFLFLAQFPNCQQKPSDPAASEVAFCLTPFSIEDPMLAADLALRHAIQFPSPEARAARAQVSELRRAIRFPSPESLAARAQVRNSRAAQRARGKLYRRQANLDAALETNEFVDSLRAAAVEAAPASSHRAAWPSDVWELSEKIERQQTRGLNPGEAKVRQRDRRMVLAQIPRGIAIESNDPIPFADGVFYGVPR